MKIHITDENKLARSFRKYDSLFILIVLLFVLISIDMFSRRPYFIVIDKTTFKYIIVAFEILFVISIIKWKIKQTEILSIIKNGLAIEGSLVDTISFRSDIRFTLYEFEYVVNGQKLRLISKGKREQEINAIIVFNKNQPEKGFVYEHLRPEFKEHIRITE